jgi:hypothetical protein
MRSIRLFHVARPMNLRWRLANSNKITIALVRRIGKHGFAYAILFLRKDIRLQFSTRVGVLLIAAMPKVRQFYCKHQFLEWN